MTIKIFEDKETMTAFMATYFVDLVQSHETLNVGFPTGNTYLTFFDQVVNKYRELPISFRRVQSFNVDSYMELSDGHPEAITNVMQRYLFDHVDIPRSQIYFPPHYEEDDYESYDSFINAYGGLDVVFLGLGINGHIAYNEPGTSKDTLTHRVSLKEETLEKLKLFFDDENMIPKEAVTMGIKTLMASKRILIAANGSHKKEAVKAMLEGEITEAFPASLLRAHDELIVVLDKEAASLLSEDIKSSFR